MAGRFLSFIMPQGQAFNINSKQEQTGRPAPSHSSPFEISNMTHHPQLDSSSDLPHINLYVCLVQTIQVNPDTGIHQK